MLWGKEYMLLLLNYISFEVLLYLDSVIIKFLYFLFGMNSFLEFAGMFSFVLTQRVL